MLRVHLKHIFESLTLYKSSLYPMPCPVRSCLPYITTWCPFGNNALKQAVFSLLSPWFCNRTLTYPRRHCTHFKNLSIQCKKDNFTLLKQRLLSAHEIRSFSIPAVRLVCANSLITEIQESIKLEISAEVLWFVLNINK